MNLNCEKEPVIAAAEDSAVVAAIAFLSTLFSMYTLTGGFPVVESMYGALVSAGLMFFTTYQVRRGIAAKAGQVPTLATANALTPEGEQSK